jgi:hypothetical protein
MGTLQKIWGAVGHITRMRSLLQWLGVWDFVAKRFNGLVWAIVASIAILIWSHFRLLPGPVQATLGLFTFAATLAVWSLVLHIRDRYGSHKSAQIELLVVKLHNEFPLREDHIGKELISIFFRSDYGSPVGVEYFAWEDPPCTKESPVWTKFLRLRGIRIETESAKTAWSYGTTKLVVRPSEVFRVTVEVQHWVRKQHVKRLDDIDDDPIGTLGLIINKQGLTFPLRYIHVKQQSTVSQYSRWLQSLESTKHENNQSIQSGTDGDLSDSPLPRNETGKCPSVAGL